MTLIETPGLLIYGEESEYYQKFLELFQWFNEILIPENPWKKILVYTNKEADCKHFWRWWQNKWWEETDTRRRAYRIWWIRYLIETQDIRSIFKDTKSGNIVFASTEIGFAVVIQDMWKFYKLVTSFVVSDPYRWYKQLERYESFEF